MSNVWYIDWRDPDRVEHIQLSQKQFNERFQFFRKHGSLVDARPGSNNRTRVLAWLAPYSYAMEQIGHQVNLYTSDNSYPRHYILYYTLLDSEKAERDLGVSGGAAFRLVDRLFQERNGVSLQVAFGRCENNFIFDQCNMALPPIIYINEDDCDYVQNNIFKADRSSAYPFEACGDLPDFHKTSMKRMKGIVNPTKEYPFAFYIKSGHLAIYEELNTYTDLRGHALYCTRGKWRDDLYGDKDETILVKRSRYKLDEVMQYMYGMKKDDPNMKTYMVAFIGYIRSTKSWQHHYMGHISAVVYARHLKEMLRLYDKVVSAKNVVEMIATDSICWKGRAMPEICQREKELGAFVLEYEDAKLLMLANGVYGLQEKDQLVVFKHQGTAAEEIDFPITKLSDIKKLKNAKVTLFDKKEGQFVEMDPVLHRRIDNRKKI